MQAMAELALDIAQCLKVDEESLMSCATELPAEKVASCQGVGRRVAERGRATIGLLGAEGQAWSRWGEAQVRDPTFMIAVEGISSLISLYLAFVRTSRPLHPCSNNNNNKKLAARKERRRAPWCAPPSPCPHADTTDPHGDGGHVGGAELPDGAGGRGPLHS